MPRREEPEDWYWGLVAPYGYRVNIYDGGRVFLRDYRRTPEASRHLPAAHWCRSEVFNGGFHQFFRMLPYVPLQEQRRLPMTAEAFEEQFTWQGLDLQPTELAVVVPTCPHLGVSMWGGGGDGEILLVFRYDFRTREVSGWTRIS